MRPYDTPEYRRLRRLHSVIVAAGRAVCWRCGKPIAASEKWDLGHDDHVKELIRGPEHRRCNRATAGRKFYTHSRVW